MKINKLTHVRTNYIYSLKFIFFFTEIFFCTFRFQRVMLLFSFDLIELNLNTTKKENKILILTTQAHYSISFLFLYKAFFNYENKENYEFFI